MFGLAGCHALSSADGTALSSSAGLGARAKRNDATYGVAVKSGTLREAPFARALKNEAAALVPESELKWATLRPSPSVFDFSGYRRIRAFAEANTMGMRGHTLVWHRANPAWLAPALDSAAKAEILMQEHITRVMAETSPFIADWDVVNEAVHPASNRADHLRPSPWLTALGPDYLPLAFHLAREANPGARLTYNEFGCEYGDGNGIARRRAVLKLLENLKKQNASVQALGLQSHVQVGRPLGGDDFLSFLSHVRAMGIEVIVTELDVDASRIRADLQTSADYLRTYLDMVQAGGRVNTLFTWGLTDRHTWLASLKQVKGALPLDARYQRGPIWNVLRDLWS